MIYSDSEVLKIKDQSAKVNLKEEVKEQKRKSTKITVKVEKRKGKKNVTIVLGLDLFVDLKKAAKILSSKYATGCCVDKTAEGNNELVLQGNFETTIKQVLREKFPEIPEENLK